MSVFVGRQGFIGIGKETSWGSPASSFSVDNRVNSIALSKSVERVRKTNLSTSSANFQETHFDSNVIVGGEIVFPLMYKGSGLLLEAALGQSNTTGAGPLYTHVYDPILDLPSLSIRANRGSGSASMEEFQGLIVNTLTISCAAGEEVIASIDFIGKESASRSAGSSPSYGDGLGIFHYEMDNSKKLKWNSNNYNIKSFELTISNNIERRFKLGSKKTAEPSYSDLRTVTLQITADLEDNNLYNSQIAGDVADLEIEFENNLSHKFTISMPNAYIQDYNDDVTGPNVIERTATFVGQADSSNKAVTITIVNDNISATSN